MKHNRPSVWMMATAIAGMTVTACSLDGNEPEKPFTTCPVSEATLYICGINESGTRSDNEAQNVLFTEDEGDHGDRRSWGQEIMGTGF